MNNYCHPNDYFADRKRIPLTKKKKEEIAVRNLVCAFAKLSVRVTQFGEALTKAFAPMKARTK